MIFIINFLLAVSSMIFLIIYINDERKDWAAGVAIALINLYACSSIFLAVYMIPKICYN